MTDPTDARYLAELVARLSHINLTLRSYGLVTPDIDEAIVALRALAAERDAALKQVRETCLQFLADQGQEIDAAVAAKPAAPTGETVPTSVIRRFPVWINQYGHVIAHFRAKRENEVEDFVKIGGDATKIYITADIPLPQPAEVAGTV